MSLATLRNPLAGPAAPSPSLWRRLARAGLITIGWLLIFVGAIGAVLPGHLGLPVLLVGLIIVLRSSMNARRRFIGLQRRHPRIVFPIRRLLRRDPEVFAVAWQQALRIERAILPRAWRPARRLRRRWFRPKRQPSA
jgi:hypothetical protein